MSIIENQREQDMEGKFLNICNSAINDGGLDYTIVHIPEENNMFVYGDMFVEKLGDKYSTQYHHFDKNTYKKDELVTMTLYKDVIKNGREMKRYIVFKGFTGKPRTSEELFKDYIADNECVNWDIHTVIDLYGKKVRIYDIIKGDIVSMIESKGDKMTKVCYNDNKIISITGNLKTKLKVNQSGPTLLELFN